MPVSLDLNNLDKKVIINDQTNYPELGKIALKKLKELGIPNKKHEHWKYTDISEPMQLLEKSLNTNYQKLSEVKTYKDNIIIEIKNGYNSKNIFKVLNENNIINNKFIYKCCLQSVLRIIY